MRDSRWHPPARAGGLLPESLAFAVRRESEVVMHFPGIVLPGYYRHYAAPVKMVATADGGVAAWRASSETGAWEPANRMIDEILFAREGDTHVLSVEEFVDRTEWW